MRQTTLTLGLGAAAVAAIALAPRLHGWMGSDVPMEPVATLEGPAVETPYVESAPEALPVEAVQSAVLTQLQPASEPPIAELSAPVRPAPLPTAIPMKTGPGSHGAIAELHAQPLPMKVDPTVEPPTPDPGWWDDCPACGMG